MRCEECKGIIWFWQETIISFGMWGKEMFGHEKCMKRYFKCMKRYFK